MPPWLTEVLKLMGFATPFVYAAATYGVFHWLDNKAAGPAKVALTKRIASGAPNTSAVVSFAVEVFDRIYTEPLLHWRALLRASIITIIVSAIVWHEAGVLVPRAPKVAPSLYRLLAWYLVFNIIADYISLFFVRALLVRAGTKPDFGLIMAALVGMFVISLTNIFREGFRLFYVLEYTESIFTVLMVSLRVFVREAFSFDPVLTRFLAPAFVVHLWFPLFAVAVVATRALDWSFKAAGWMQWFIKRGQHHPFQAVGLVASVIVFASSAVIQILTR